MSKRVIVMNFEVASESYQAFSEVKQLVLKRELKAEQMAVVTHQDDGSHQFKIEDFMDFTGNDNASKGGFIGMLVGVLISPLAILLGWFGGSMIGATRDAKEISEAQDIFKFLLNKIAPGQTGLIVIAEEEDNRPLNKIVFEQLHGEITRFDYDEVQAEIQKAQQVTKETKEKVDKGETTIKKSDERNAVWLFD